MFRNMLNDQSSVQIYDPLAPSRYFSTKYPTIRMICQSRPISHFSNNCIFYSPLPPDIYGESLPFLQWINIVLQLFSLLHNLFLKCFAVVYLCIACWACLPVHGNKNINQNIFTLMYGRMFLNICKKPKTYLLLWTFIVSSFVTFVVCLFVFLSVYTD